MPQNTGQKQNEKQPSARERKEKTLSAAPAVKQQDFPTEKQHPMLRADYSFRTFVEGDNNSFAYNAAIAVGKNPGHSYNPFLIYGGVGLGKTHLMQAIGNLVYGERGGKVIYITAETFTNEFIQSLQAKDKSSTEFKKKYRSADVLLIDDIHFLQNKKGVQEELFYTFEALYGAYKQMVFTCDRPLTDMKGFNDRLLSRFTKGLNVDLQPPSYETRCAILNKKLENRDTHIPQEVIELIARNVETNVRDLEASLTKLIAYEELVNKPITMEIAQQQLKDTFYSSKQSNFSVEQIQKIVAEYWNISYIDLKSKKRTQKIAFPRQVAMYIAREITEYSTTELGMEFGGRDHTTVMHSCQKIEEKIKSDPTMDTIIQSLIRKIREHKNNS